jgi:hypothetical protein
MKIWTSTEKGDDRIIAYIDQTIYSGNPKLTDLDACVEDLKIRKMPDNSFISIPQRYLKSINLESGNGFIEVLYGADSSEHLRIKNEKTRTEIFEYFKAHIPNSISSLENYSKVRAGKKPLIAMVVVALIFSWALYVANGLESGNEYEVVGSHRSLASIILVVAALGVKKVILIFGVLFAVAGLAFAKKISKPLVSAKIMIQR